MRKLTSYLFTLVVMVITSCALFEPYEVSSKPNTQPKPSWPICYESSWDQVTHGDTPAFRLTLYENGTVSMEIGDGEYTEKFDGYYYGFPLQNGKIRFVFRNEFDKFFEDCTIEGNYLFITNYFDGYEYGPSLTTAFKRKEN